MMERSGLIDGRTEGTRPGRFNGLSLDRHREHRREATGDASQRPSPQSAQSE